MNTARATLCACFLLALVHCGVLAAGGGGLGEACLSGNTCTDNTTHVCDTNQPTPKCLIKNGTTCTGNTDKCVDGATCPTDTCVCGTGRTPATAAGLCASLGALGASCKAGNPETCSNTVNHVCDTNKQQHLCLIKNGSDCTGADTTKCVDGATCDQGKCLCGTNRPATAAGLCAPPPAPGTLGGDCQTGNTCTTTADHVCDSNKQQPICLIKNGTNCTVADTNKCVDGATCDHGKCLCGTGRPATAAGVCAPLGALGASCKAGTPETCSDTVKHVCDTSKQQHLCLIKNGTDCTGADNKCVDGATCDHGKCLCGTGRSATATGVCTPSGSAAVFGSILVMAAAFLTTRLA